MERDLAPVVEVLDDINENKSVHDPSLPSGGKISRRASLFGSFLAFFCCSATTMSMSRRCSIQIVDSESSSPLSDGSNLTAQVGVISIISLSDELNLSLSGEAISEEDKRSIQSPASEESDSIQAEDSTPQSIRLDETITEQDRGNIPSPAYEENISGPGSEESGTTESEDSTSQGYVTADELSLGETVSEQNRGNIPTPAYEGYDFIEYEDSASAIYVTANELTQDSFPQLPSSPLSIESTFPPQISAPGTLRRAFQQKNKPIRRAGGLRNVST
ncbi:hypothetical protein DY000_02013678 [Brassica cretica]|uniref:Uncharacterized protein n=1 Tax=Brassica cretica TaxID=69181 RepID=A0ABQ7D4M3_BRACR|nr:hypothetical protein DY000_02013678 [Brassica cretica]